MRASPERAALEGYRGGPLRTELHDLKVDSLLLGEPVDLDDVEPPVDGSELEDPDPGLVAGGGRSRCDDHCHKGNSDRQDTQ